MFHRGSAIGLKADGYKDAAEKLDAFLTNDHVATAVVNTAGTGYVVGDILTIVGGTVVEGLTAQLQVMTVGGGGDITGVRVYSAGAYSADPTLSANAATGGTGSGADFDLTMDVSGWTQLWHRAWYAATYLPLASGISVVNSIANAGSLFVTGDIVSLSGPGTVHDPAIFEVTASAGAITAVTMRSRGAYSGTGTATYNLTAVTGSGTGGQLNVTVISNNAQKYHNEHEYVWEGDGGGSEEIQVGLRTFALTGSVYSWQIAAFKSYNTGVDWQSQVDMSPGNPHLAMDPATTKDNGPVNSGGGSYVPSFNTGTDVPFWFAVSPRRIVGELNAGTNYNSFYMGFVDPFFTAGEYPYPMYVCGSTNNPRWTGNESNLGFGSIADPRSYNGSSITTGSSGPGYLRTGSGTWLRFFNSSISTGGTRTENFVTFTHPCGRCEPGTLSGVFGDINICGSTTAGPGPMSSIFPLTGSPGSQTVRFGRTPTADGPQTLPIQCTIATASTSNGRDIVGELDGVFMVPGNQGVSSLLSEDTITISGVVYRIFQSGSRTDNWNWMAIREN